MAELYMHAVHSCTKKKKKHILGGLSQIIFCDNILNFRKAQNMLQSIAKNKNMKSHFFFTVFKA